MYWHIEAKVGKNTVIGRVTATDKDNAIKRGLAAVHAKYPNSLVVLLGGSVRPVCEQ